MSSSLFLDYDVVSDIKVYLVFDNHIFLFYWKICVVINQCINICTGISHKKKRQYNSAIKAN